MKHYLLVLVGFFILSSCSSKRNQNQAKTRVTTGVETEKEKPTHQGSKTQAKLIPVEKKKEEKPAVVVQLPEVSREFRAAWIASVANINWPSKNNLSTEEQQQEVITILDFLKTNHFNAAIFQVRPSSDALYQSDLEPWSYFLNGEQGRAPSPYYDPLAFWVAEAHKRGIELHVWLNPYRAHHTAGGRLSDSSMVKRMPASIVKLKQGYYWFDPSLQSTQDHAARVVMDIVKRYDIDGVHFDDYFYPYAEYNGGQDFPDDASWALYRKTGGSLSRGDWRRNSVNTFIERIYKEIKAEKNFVKFGISPFGIWKPGFPAGIQGSSQYDMLYADAKLWLNKGWVDYYTPQLYWPIAPAKQSFTSLLKWWESENTMKRHLWPGINTVGKRTVGYTDEILNQIAVMREVVPNSKGIVHWSLAGLTKNPAMTKAIIEGPYREEVLIPRTSWLNANPLLKPSLLLTQEKDQLFVKWQHQQIDQVFHWLLYCKYGNEWSYEILDAHVLSKSIALRKNGQKLEAVAVKAVDRLSNESPYQAELVK